MAHKMPSYSQGIESERRQFLDSVALLDGTQNAPYSQGIESERRHFLDSVARPDGTRGALL
jgi:hypothetical protein